MDKVQAIDAFAALLQTRLTALTAGSDAAQAGARVDGTHRPATRGERGAVSEQAALAHGLRVRATALATALRHLDDVPRISRDRVGPGAAVELMNDEDCISWWLILPGGQGDAVSGTTVVSPDSPIARALHGLEAGDAVQLRQRGAHYDYEVMSVV